ncbi:methyltransferase domain-containing protein [Colletotrichum abscissum]|uniref:methyltransferase domain-containing protein n=1 Tax=Colletotrichum abscissum TaxID=1671311 RepID=UPI0027D4C8B4|nr:methyltransferase domain-containing protein [Colletotrichum abscissum]KAK1520931.1 methyltransferase domain-containing protein [Colletotrichum abscissum]
MTTTESKTASLAELNRVFWDANADTFLEQDWIKVFSEQLTRFLRAQAPNLGLRPRDANPSSNPVRLLDYACASGGASWALSPFVDSILGIDIAPAIVRRYNDCAARLGYSPEQVHAVVGDLAVDGELAAEGGFDVVIISMALHHLDDPRGMLDLLAKRVRPGGVVIAVEGVDYKAMRSESKMLEKGDEKGGKGSGRHGGKAHEHEIHQHDVLKTTNRHLVFSEELFRGWFRDAGCDEGKFAYVENEEVSHIPEEASGKVGGLDRKMVIASSVRKE